MDHHRCSCTFEGSRVDEIDLAARVLLCWCTKDRETDPEFIDKVDESEASTDACCGNDIVPASLAHLRQGIHLCTDDDLWPRCPCSGGERRVETVRRVLDVETSSAEHLSHLSGCLELLVPKFGVVVHPL